MGRRALGRHPEAAGASARLVLSLPLTLACPPNEAVKANCVCQHISPGRPALAPCLLEQLIAWSKSHPWRRWASRSGQTALCVFSGSQLASWFHTLEIFWVSTAVFNHRFVLFHDYFLIIAWEKLHWAPSQPRPWRGQLHSRWCLWVES